ncbi:MAG TPA: hypothetical protein VJ921_04980 [Vicinamibacteria bacterium]|nr:hypothetical protein [Vicinamibacteria bacterium]
MALNGLLEEMTLLEILQIVAFSKKTRTLADQGPLTRDLTPIVRERV